MKGERGFALLMVLWTMAMLALLVTQFSATGRMEAQVVGNMRANAVMQAAADGAVHEAILRLLQGTWSADGQMHRLYVADATIEVGVRSQAQTINPNTASPLTIQALLRKLDVDPDRAATLTRAMVEWRTPSPRSGLNKKQPTQYQAAGLQYGPASQPFESLDEIGLVMGMTRTLLARMKPFLSIYQEGEEPGPGDPLAGILKDVPARSNGGWYLGSTGLVMVVLIEAKADDRDGRQFTRQAIVRLRAEASLDQTPYEILTWETTLE